MLLAEITYLTYTTLMGAISNFIQIVFCKSKLYRQTRPTYFYSMLSRHRCQKPLYK